MKPRTRLRIPCASHGEMAELALRLEADGYSVIRRWRTVIARVETPDEGERLVQRLGLETRPRSGYGSEPGSASPYTGQA